MRQVGLDPLAPLDQQAPLDQLVLALQETPDLQVLPEQPDTPGHRDHKVQDLRVLKVQLDLPLRFKEASSPHLLPQDRLPLAQPLQVHLHTCF